MKGLLYLSDLDELRDKVEILRLIPLEKDSARLGWGIIGDVLGINKEVSREVKL